MTKNKNDNPDDEFDRIAIPAFLARPFEALGSRTRPAGPSDRTGSADRTRPMDPTDQAPAAPRFPGAPGYPGAPSPVDADSADAEQPKPRSWWAGSRGKLLLYGVGTVVMVFLQAQR